MDIRLPQLAKQYNIGVSHLIEFLASNGQKDLTPGSRVSVDEKLRTLLDKNYQKDIAEKNEAEKLRPTPPPPAPKRVHEEPPAPKVEPVVVVAPKAETPKAEGATPKAAVIAPKAEVETPKTAAITSEVETPKVEPAVVKSLPSFIVSQPDKNAPKPTPVVTKSDAAKRKDAKPSIEQKKKEQNVAVVADKQPIKDKPKQDNKPKPESKAVVVDTPVPPPAPEPRVEIEVKRAQAPELRGLKVLGKVNIEQKETLSAEEKNNRQKERKKKERIERQERERKDQNARQTAQTALNKQNEATKKVAEVPKSDAPVVVVKPVDTVIRASDSAKRYQAGGMKIVGKIDLPTVEAANSESAEAKKRKRKRKKVATGRPADLNQLVAKGVGGTASTNTNNRPSNNTSGGVRKPGVGVPLANRPSQSGVGNNANKKPAVGGRRDAAPELTKKEVDDKIRATLAKLGGGGKNKRAKSRRDDRERKRERQSLLNEDESQGKLLVTEFVSVSELASLMDIAVTEIIKTCMSLGHMVGINQRLDAEIIEIIAEEFGFEAEFQTVGSQSEQEVDDIVDEPASLLPRSPIVTVMGHVDHGKTSLLDYIHNKNVVSGEAGGITQHLGAYEIVVGEEQRKITFLDTPGHEAFTAMRARGAKVTDVAIILIAADDGIMATTREAISHAQAANVPMIFAINKIDKDGANPERVREQLSQMNILVEEWGGQYQCQEIAAKKGTGVDELLEKILLQADMLELTANPDRVALGTILEASQEKGRGYVAKLLVQNGSLRKGDIVLAGQHWGKVKNMFDEQNKVVKEAGPSTPVLILGLSGAPQAGDILKVMATEADARQIAAKRAQIARNQEIRATKRISLDEIARRLALGNFKELRLIVKGDFDGSVEALSDSLIKLGTEQVAVSIIHRGVGAITESDVNLASVSDAIIVAFQVRPAGNARLKAEQEGVQIKTYSIIYEAIEEIKMAIEGMLEPTKEERITCTVEVRNIFTAKKIGTIIGGYVQDGKIFRNTKIRVIRDNIVIFPIKENQVGEISSLKRIKDDVREVARGFEFGMVIKDFNDVKEGDIIEGYEIVEIKQKL